MCLINFFINRFFNRRPKRSRYDIGKSNKDFIKRCNCCNYILESKYEKLFLYQDELLCISCYKSNVLDRWETITV